MGDTGEKEGATPGAPAAVAVAGAAVAVATTTAGAAVLALVAAAVGGTVGAAVGGAVGGAVGAAVVGETMDSASSPPMTSSFTKWLGYGAGAVRLAPGAGIATGPAVQLAWYGMR